MDFFFREVGVVSCPDPSHAGGEGFFEQEVYWARRFLIFSSERQGENHVPTPVTRNGRSVRRGLCRWFLFLSSFFFLSFFFLLSLIYLVCTYLTLARWPVDQNTGNPSNYSLPFILFSPHIIVISPYSCNFFYLYSHLWHTHDRNTNHGGPPFLRLENLPPSPTTISKAR